MKVWMNMVKSKYSFWAVTHIEQQNLFTRQEQPHNLAVSESSLQVPKKPHYQIIEINVLTECRWTD